MEQKNKEKVVTHLNEIKALLIEIGEACENAEDVMYGLEEVLLEDKIMKNIRTGKGTEM